MKNKKFLVIIATALMACLVVGMGAMTYSRYISTTTAPTQSATAAKWNYTINVTADKLFGKNYTYDNTAASSLVVTTNGEAVRASAETTANIVAPGTSGYINITVGGYSEVLAQFKMSITGTEMKYHDGTYPIVWKINDSGNYKTFAELQTAMNSLPSTATWDTTGNTGFVFTATTHKLSWEWAFSEDNEISIKDTLIGYKAANVDWTTVKTVKGATGVAFADYLTGDDASDLSVYNAIVTTMQFDLSVTVEQIQKA